MAKHQTHFQGEGNQGPLSYKWTRVSFPWSAPHHLTLAHYHTHCPQGLHFHGFTFSENKPLFSCLGWEYSSGSQGGQGLGLHFVYQLSSNSLLSILPHTPLPLYLVPPSLEFLRWFFRINFGSLRWFKLSTLHSLTVFQILTPSHPLISLLLFSCRLSSWIYTFFLPFLFSKALKETT